MNTKAVTKDVMRKLLKGSTVAMASWLAIGGVSCGFSTTRAAQGPDVPPVEVVPARPVAPAKPEAGDSAGKAVLRVANRTTGSKIMVSTRDRWLWYVVKGDTVLSAPVAVGMGKDFSYKGKKFHFATPVGRRKVLKKEESPIWTVPEWHYMEKAAERNLELVRLTPTSKVELSDGTWLVVQGQDVGRINQFGNFWAFTPGTEIVFDGKIFIPPLTTEQRRVPDALGPYKLDTGQGYLIHGTHIYNTESIGQAVSHGCVRMSNEDLERLYFMVDPGTPVFIF